MKIEYFTYYPGYPCEKCSAQTLHGAKRIARSRQHVHVAFRPVYEDGEPADVIREVSRKGSGGRWVDRGY